MKNINLVLLNYTYMVYFFYLFICKNILLSQNIKRYFEFIYFTFIIVIIYGNYLHFTKHNYFKKLYKTSSLMLNIVNIMLHFIVPIILINNDILKSNDKKFNIDTFFSGIFFALIYTTVIPVDKLYGYKKKKLLRDVILLWLIIFLLLKSN